MAEENGKLARTVISEPLGIAVERHYKLTCASCAEPADAGSEPVPVVIYDGDRDQAHEAGKAHAAAHRNAARRPLAVGAEDGAEA